MTDHPCKGMTKAQVAAFEQIAVNAVPQCTWGTLDALLKAGVVVRGTPEVRRDVMGVYEIPNFYVPLPLHMQWCAWCSEQYEPQPEETTDGSVEGTRPAR